ncbi:SEC-C domain-containing protein [Bacillus tianshenii]|uniref:SEC-C metal-binding domain-containing protein n=1 Tax=Sutcliffiella tianshenii TaxID=1463404 RepID=UPI001CD6BE35|nr:SEC-C metal-binding domain-containing protein [Bacillus tianshenii]MCA1320452.1 SEC-C domain-containing protein [Bacillus tianshenii]
MIGRNEPCPCGSGRKYKKCCEKEQSASFEKVLESELMALQIDIMRYAYDKYASELEEAASKYVHKFELDQDKREAYQEIVHLWYMFTVVRESGQTIVQEFVKVNESKFSRPQVKEWAENWQTAQPSIYKVSNVRGGQYTMEDCFTNEKVKVKFIDREEGLSKNELVVGMFVPFQDAHVVFMSTFERGTLEAIRIEEKLQALLENESLTKDQVRSMFPMLAGNVIEFELSEEDVQELPVQNDAQEKVLELFVEAAEKRGYPKRFQEFAHMLWSIYCMKESPAIRNEPNYAAALIYFLDVHFMQEQVETQKSLSEEFGISPGSVSSTFRKLDEVLQPVIQTFQQDIEAALN